MPEKWLESQYNKDLLWDWIEDCMVDWWEPLCEDCQYQSLCDQIFEIIAEDK